MIVDIPDIEKKLSDYFSKEYNQDGEFMFSHIGYRIKYFEYGHETKMLDLNNEGRMITKKEDTEVIQRASASVPIFVPSGNDILSDYGKYMTINSGLNIKEIIDIGTSPNFDTSMIPVKLREELPKEVIMIDEETLGEAMQNLGLPQYEFHFENLGSLGDGRIRTICSCVFPEDKHSIKEAKEMASEAVSEYNKINGYYQKYIEREKNNNENQR